MKNLKSIMATLMVALIVAFVCVGCKKEKETAKPIDSAPTIEQDGMNAYLKDFKERMQSSEKANETLNLEDAIWHLEAVLNYSYANAGNQITDIKCDTFIYTIQTLGDEMNLTQINDAFNDLSEDIEIAFNKSNLPNKNILSIQTEFENNAKTNTINVKNIVTTSGVSTVNMWFDETDYWNEYYEDFGNGSHGGGKCGPYAGEGRNSGAPHELTKKLNMRLPSYAHLSRSGYFTDIQTFEISPIPIDYGYEYDEFLTDENSPCLYKIYCNSNIDYDPYSTPNGCIPPEDMNYYLSKGPEIIAHYQPEGKVIISARYYFNVIVGFNRSGTTFHVLEVRYGIFHSFGE